MVGKTDNKIASAIEDTRDKIDLSQRSLLSEGVQKISYPLNRFDFRGEITRLLIQKGFIDKAVPLEELNTHIPYQQQVVDQNLLCKVGKTFYETSVLLRNLHFELQKYLAEEVLGFDFIFQEIPTVRFHFPVPLIEAYRSSEGVYLGHHSDTMLGHPFAEINCWFPLTECSQTNALQLSSLEDGKSILESLCQDIAYDADTYHKQGRNLFYQKLIKEDEYRQLVINSCHPVAMQYGELLLFDPRCIHGPVENKEEQTRVSMDFRIIPLESYEKMTREYRSQ